MGTPAVVVESDVVSPGRYSTVRNLARAVFMVPPFLVQHLWRRRRIDDVTITVDRLSEQPPNPSGVSDDAALQAAPNGSGPLVMRSYEVRIEGATRSPDELMQQLVDRPATLNDDRIAAFVADDDPATDLRGGDDLVVELPGPWNGPVRVTDASGGRLLLHTLDGHMEAGQIRFDTTARNDRPDGTHEFTFRVRSWARGGDPVFTILHLGVGVAKELQTAMWVAMCEGAVRESGGRRSGRILVRTEVLTDSAPDGDVIGDVLEIVGSR